MPSRSMSARRSAVVVGRRTPGSSTPPRSMAVRRPPCAPAAPLRPPHESQRSLAQTQEGPSAVSTTFGARSRHCAGTRVCQRSFGSHWRSMWSSAEMIRYSIASSAYVWPLLVEKAPALVGELVEQRRRPPEITAGLLLERQQPVADRLEPDLIGPEHRAAAIDGPAVAVHPDDVDVARSGPCGCASRRRGQRDRSWRTGPWAGRSPSAPCPPAGATRPRAAGARTACRADGACGYRRSRGRRRPAPALC